MWIRLVRHVSKGIRLSGWSMQSVLSLRIRPMNELTAPERECYAAASNLGRKDKHVRYI